MSTQVTRTGAGTAARTSSSLGGIIAVVMLGALMMQLDTTMTALAARTLVTDFHTTLATIQWVTTGYLLGMAVTIPLAGWALQRFGARRVWTASIGVFLAGSVACGLAFSPASLTGFRVLQGLGAGMVLPVAQAVLALSAPPEKLGKVMAALGVPAVVGPVAGPVLGGVLVTDLSWRWIFYINVPVCLAAMALSRRAMPAEPAPGSSRLDWTGLALLSPGCAAIVLGLSQSGQQHGFTGARVLVPLAVGAVLLAAFCANALRTPHALVDLRLLTRRAFGSASASVFASGFVLFGAMGALPLYYQIARGDTAQHAGLLLIPLGLGTGLSLFIAGGLADKVPLRLIALTGTVLTAAGTLAYTQLSADTSQVLLGAAQVAIGFGMGGLLVPIMALAFLGLEPASVPRASTSIRIMQQLGSSFGSAVMFVIVGDQLAGNAPTAAGTAAAFATTFRWILAFAAVMIAFVAFLPGARKAQG